VNFGLAIGIRPHWGRGTICTPVWSLKRWVG
jgi:hypothetical protein